MQNKKNFLGDRRLKPDVSRNWHASQWPPEDPVQDCCSEPRMRHVHPLYQQVVLGILLRKGGFLGVAASKQHYPK